MFFSRFAGGHHPVAYGEGNIQQGGVFETGEVVDRDMKRKKKGIS